MKYKTYYLSFIGDYSTIVKVRAKTLKDAKIKASNLFASIPAKNIQEDDEIIDCKGYMVGGYEPEDIQV